MPTFVPRPGRDNILIGESPNHHDNVSDERRTTQDAVSELEKLNILGWR